MTHPYATMEFAKSLTHWGNALWVEAWQTAVIVRDIEGVHKDAAGCYPICALAKEGDIAAGIAELKAAGLVSVVLVLDDMHRPSIDAIEPYVTFIKPFKTHYVYDRTKGALSYDTHHARALKKAQKEVRVGVLDLHTHAKDWQVLYDQIIEKFSLTGLHAFDLAHVEQLATIDGITAIGAWADDELVSAHIWACDDKTAFSHLVASSDKGYDMRAGFAVNDFSLAYFADKDVINFGGGAGIQTSDDDGLARFKRGFSNASAQSYLCGIILDEARYQCLSAGKNTEYFPAYRAL